MRSILLCAFVLALAACGGEATVSSSSTVIATTTSTTGSGSVGPTTTTEGSSTTVVEITTTTTRPVDVTLANGVVSGPDRVRVSRSDLLSVTVVSDEEGEIHVHGYDLFFDMTPGQVIEISLQADVAGIFEVEVEESGLKLFEIEVSG